MATQTRIVLNPAVQQIAQEIKEATNASSLSEVMTLLLSRYGAHFVAWWKTNPHQHELLPVLAAQPTEDIDFSAPLEL